MSRDKDYLRLAIDVSRHCPVSSSAYAVGAVLTSLDGEILTTGYSRETGDKEHAEEVAIAKAVNANIDLSQTQIFSSMEPCSTRASKELSCCDLIIKMKIPRVIFCVKEPDLFVTCTGLKTLETAGIEILHDPTDTHMVYAINQHLFPHQEKGTP